MHRLRLQIPVVCPAMYAGAQSMMTRQANLSPLAAPHEMTSSRRRGDHTAHWAIPDATGDCRERFGVTRYAIIAAAAALAAGLFLQTQAFACPRILSTLTVTPLARSNAGLPQRPDQNRPPTSMKAALVVILTGLAVAVGAGGTDAKVVTPSKGP